MGSTIITWRTVMKIRHNLLIISLLLSLVVISGCGNNYDDIKEQLNGKTWYYNAGSDDIVNSITFEGDKASLTQTSEDPGMGVRIAGDSTECDYTIDDSNITVTIPDGDGLTIPYKSDEESITIGSGDFFTPEEIDESLQGYWSTGRRELKLNGGLNTVGQDDILLEQGMLTYKGASCSSLDPDTFYPKEEGPFSYTIGLGTIECDMSNHQMWTWNIVNNEPVIYYLDKACERTDRFPTLDEYDEITTLN